jgi:hypothetical protein
LGEVRNSLLQYVSTFRSAYLLHDQFDIINKMKINDTNIAKLVSVDIPLTKKQVLAQKPDNYIYGEVDQFIPT